MQRLDLTLATPGENLALDEALLDQAETDGMDVEFLRLWESPEPVVVVGRSSRVGQEVDLSTCRERRIPILRRASGGAAIVAGPGCLMYALVLSYRLRPELRDIRCAHRMVLGRIAGALPSNPALTVDVTRAGTSDLVLVSAPPKKFSGNSLRAKRTHLLYHGTLLYNFDLSLIPALLKMPSRQPIYREGRPHGDFLANLPLPRSTLVDAIESAWPTEAELQEWPRDRVATLVEERFSRDDWNFAFG